MIMHEQERQFEEAVADLGGLPGYISRGLHADYEPEIEIEMVRAIGAPDAWPDVVWIKASRYDLQIIGRDAARIARYAAAKIEIAKLQSGLP